MVPSSPIAAGLENELAGFGDGHEEPPDLGIGHCHGAASADLLLERVEHGPAGAEHIAEPHGQVRSGRSRREAADQPLGHPLVASELARRRRRLVRGDVDEGLDLGRRRGLEDVERPVDVGLPRLLREPLEHRQVLEGRGVEDDLRSRRGEDPVEGLPVPDIGEYGVRGGEERRAEEGELDSVEGGLIAIEENEGFGSQRGQPPAQFGRRSNRPHR